MRRHGNIAILLALCGIPSTTLADTLLEADFDDKVIDAPIGTGGAAVGEPVSVDPTIVAIVRPAPFPTPSLEISDNSSCCAGSARFEFLGSIEVTTGVITINAELWFDVLENYILYVREQGSSADSFLSIGFSSSGDISANDADTDLGLIGSYETDRVYPVSLVYDMDAGTYDIYLDGCLVVEDEPHGVVGNGVGAVLFGMGHDSNLTGRYSVDNILVCEGESPNESCCPADVDGSGDVGFGDLVSVLSNWGPCVGCPEDIDQSGDVGFGDLLEVLANWGPCE